MVSKEYGVKDTTLPGVFRSDQKRFAEGLWRGFQELPVGLVQDLQEHIHERGGRGGVLQQVFCPSVVGFEAVIMAFPRYTLLFQLPGNYTLDG